MKPSGVPIAPSAPCGFILSACINVSQCCTVDHVSFNIQACIELFLRWGLQLLSHVSSVCLCKNKVGPNKKTNLTIFFLHVFTFICFSHLNFTAVALHHETFPDWKDSIYKAEPLSAENDMISVPGQGRQEKLTVTRSHYSLVLNRITSGQDGQQAL